MFYESSTVLIDSISEYVATGLEQDESCIVIARPEHRCALETALALSGTDLEFERSRGRYVALDAEESLSTFMCNGMPDPRLFRESIGAVVAASALRGRHVRAFGEMVTLLCLEGNHAAAIRLEELWTELAQTQPFSLYCAYPVECFAGAADEEKFSAICGRHTHIIPSESYTALASVDDRLREVARIQQRSRALEAEIAYRRKIEASLALRERELADFFDNAVEGLHKVGPDGTILWANRAELEMLGYSADEYIGRPIAEFHSDQVVIKGMLERLLKGEALINQPAVLRHKDGSTRHVLIHSNGHFENGEFMNSRCFTRDVTDLQLMREELDRHVTEIETLNEQLKRAVTETHHRVKNNLQVISALIEMLALEHKGENAVPLEEFARIQSHVRTLAVAHDLLTAGTKQDATGQLVSAKDVLERLLPMLQQTAWDKTVYFEISEILLPSKQCVALSLVINELVTNALKHGNTEADISLSVVDGLAVLLVSDDGPGFPAGFDPVRCANTGLELVASLVRTDLNGESEFSVGPHGGGRVRVSFPVDVSVS